MSNNIKHDNPDACISCNICLTACPVAKASRVYRGPKLNGPALSRLRMLVEEHQDPMVKFCSNCKNCDRVCPSGTPIAALNMKARAEYFKHNPHDIADVILSNNENLGKLMTAIPFVGSCANIGAKIAAKVGVMDKLGIDGETPLPKYAAMPLYYRYKMLKQPSCSKKVLFFPGCFVNYNEPELGITLIKVLNRNNVEVIMDRRLTCCGSPILSTGYLDKVEKHAQKNVTILKEYADKGIDIITTCTTCSLFLTQEYEELFNFKEIHAYAPRVYEAMEYLMKLEADGDLRKSFGAVRYNLAYHTPCHLKLQAMERSTLDVMKMIPAVQVDDMRTPCCGLSGVYGYKKDTAPIAKVISQDLHSRIKESDATLGLCECNICRIQMMNGTGKKAIHPLYVVEESYKMRERVS